MRHMNTELLKQRASAFLQTVSASALPTMTLGREGLEDTAAPEAASDLAAGAAPFPVLGTSLSENLEYRETLGEGGMGIVRVALQRSVGRDVAVKSLKPRNATAARSDSDAQRSRDAALLGQRLLEEAWITGALEHPNIVPIYDIGRAADGSPLIMMRRIVGSSWDKSLDTEPGPKDDAYLERQLGILMQVANAIAAAHALGIVHRDLKPENVMLGSYGEVYVVDWGIAVALEALSDDADARRRNPNIPVLAGSTIVGTPCYMAPEMLSGQASRATDVYLLAGMAFEIATGRPPHDAPSMAAAVASIVKSPPEIPRHVDEGLADLMRKCLASDAEARLKDANEFAEALRAYLTTRSSVRETRLGMVELAQLEERAGKAQVSVAEIEGLLGIARFSFQAALREWRDNAAAKSGLERAYVAAGRHALRQGEPERALTIAVGAPVEAQGEALAALLSEAQGAAEKRQRELAALAARGDIQTGARTRAFVALMTSLVWFIGPCVGWWHASTTGSSFPHEVAMASGLQLVVWAGLSIWARDSMTKTALNRAIMRIGFLLPIYMTTVDLLLSHAGYGQIEIARGSFVGYNAILLALAIFVSNRVFSAGVAVATAACMAGIRWPELRYPMALLSNAPVFLAASTLAIGEWIRQRRSRAKSAAT
jgi:eukaryotic-like serine/threonine-protein kinase